MKLAGIPTEVTALSDCSLVIIVVRNNFNMFMCGERGRTECRENAAISSLRGAHLLMHPTAYKFSLNCRTPASEWSSSGSFRGLRHVLFPFAPTSRRTPLLSFPPEDFSINPRNRREKVLRAYFEFLRGSSNETANLST